MTRLFDLFIRDGVWIKGERHRINSLDAANELPVFDVQNVADYYHSHIYTEDRTWDTRDMPNVAPPFDDFWCEFNLRSKYFHDAPIDIDVPAGVELHAQPLPDSMGVGWSLSAAIYQLMAGRIQFMVCVQMVVNQDGSIREIRDDNGGVGGYAISFPYTTEEYSKMGHLPDDTASMGEHCVSNILNPVLLAISFMHCRNVKVETRVPPEKLSRKHQKKHGQPLIKFYILDIDPMRRVLKSEGESDKTGLRRALHICRGHFRTYLPDKPLFGHFSGTVWVPSHTRGTLDEGIVDKEYRVKPPRR